MRKMKLTIKIHGDDELDIRGHCRRVGESGGWVVDEERVFDESEGKMLTRQLYSQDFEDPAAAEKAARGLEAAIRQISTIAVVICPEPVSV